MAAKKRKGRAGRKVKTKTPARGMANQVSGAAQDVYGQATNATKSGVVKLDQWSRNAVETQPYKSALVVFGTGLLLGEIGGLLSGKTQGIGSRLGRNIQGIGWFLGRNSKDMASKVADTAQGAYGQAANATRNGASKVGNAVESQPYTSALIALGTGGVLGGIGWLLGRMNRPM